MGYPSNEEIMKRPYPIKEFEVSNKVIGLFSSLIEFANGIAALGFFLLSLSIIFSSNNSILSRLNVFDFDISYFIGRILLLLFLGFLYICTMGFITTFVVMAHHISEIRLKMLYLPNPQKPFLREVVNDFNEIFKKEDKVVAVNFEVKSIGVNEPFEINFDNRFNQITKTIKFHTSLSIDTKEKTPKYLRNLAPIKCTLTLTFLSNVNDFLEATGALGNIYIGEYCTGEFFLPIEDYGLYNQILIDADNSGIDWSEKWYKKFYIIGIVNSTNKNITHLKVDSLHLTFFDFLSSDLTSFT